MILDLFFPKQCLECKKSGRYVCDSCFEKVLDGTFDKNNFSIFKYKGVIKKAIISIKYKFATDICEELVDRCIERLKIKKFHDVCLVSIPLHWHRENLRGFNQSEIIGEKLAKAMNWKFVPDLLTRNRSTIPQVGLRGFARRQNLSGVFSVKPNHLISLNSNILLFDDVYTTGSTINEAKKTLKNIGFKKVYNLTIAR